jgi:hypothetical protein
MFWNFLENLDELKSIPHLLAKGYEYYSPIDSLDTLGECHTNDIDRMTRSKSDGLVDNPLRGEDTLVSHAASIWNSSRPLREATTRVNVSILTIYITVFVNRGRHFGARESV